MYRQYENPRELEKELKRKEADNDGSYEAYMDIMELKDRINFAWQDEEYDMEVCRYER